VGRISDETEESKEFFENTWTPLCKIYELDPNAKPTMFGRLSLEDYLIKNGVKGTRRRPTRASRRRSFLIFSSKKKHIGRRVNTFTAFSTPTICLTPKTGLRTRLGRRKNFQSRRVGLRKTPITSTL